MPDIRDLAVIGDRRTAAVLDGKATSCGTARSGSTARACSLPRLIPKAGRGASIYPRPGPAGRRYLGDSGILETRLRMQAGEWLVTDFMTVGRNVPRGVICRLFAAAPDEARVIVRPRPIARGPT